MTLTTFVWFIENFSYCCLKKGDMLYSPKLFADEMERTVWNLSICPRGDHNDAGEMCIYLNRNDDDGPDELPMQYEMSIVSEGESTRFGKRTTCDFPKKYRQKCEFINAITAFIFAPQEYLPNDTLTIRCKIWTTGNNTAHAAPICARTRFEIEQVSFLHVVKDFTKIEPNVKKSVQLQSRLRKGGSILSSFYITDDLCCEKSTLILQIKPLDSKCVLFKCKVSVVDVNGNVIICAEKSIRFYPTKTGIEEFSLSISKAEILKMKHEYLPGDCLSLLCDCTFSNGIEFNRTDGGQVEIAPTSVMQSRNYTNFTAFYSKKLSACPSVVDDLQDLFSRNSFTDVKFETKHNVFPAHKAVLCARSPVFRSMFSNDMSETHSAAIHVHDMEDATVQQMLLFLYSDKVKDLQWNTAYDLYYAADKYDIEKLKLMCSTFLVENLSTYTALELLLLADTHGDYNLKKVAEDFILENVLASQNLEESNRNQSSVRHEDNTTIIQDNERR